MLSVPLLTRAVVGFTHSVSQSQSCVVLINLLCKLLLVLVGANITVNRMITMLSTRLDIPEISIPLTLSHVTVSESSTPSQCTLT